MTASPDLPAMKPRKTARQARSAATIEVIVEAAARILETAGVAGYTTNAVAERAGVSVGSLYQYFPNKDAITRALIRRELDTLKASIMAIDPAEASPSPLSCLVAVAVEQQTHRAALAQLLEIEEDRLGAADDSGPVRERVAAALSAILGVASRPDEHAIVQDVMALIATLVNAAAGRAERDPARLAARVEAVVHARLQAA